MKYKPEDIIKRNCKSCGEMFRTYLSYQVYCSELCREKYYKVDLEVSKELIFQRDGYTCIYCGKSSIEDGVKLHVDHVYPISKGGKEDIFNLVTACKRCNIKKKDKILKQETMMRIWERNEKLNRHLKLPYDELKKIFLRDIDARLRK